MINRYYFKQLYEVPQFNNNNNDNNNNFDIGQNTEKSPGDLRELAVSHTSAKDHQLTRNNNNNNYNNNEETCCHSNSSERPSANADVNYSNE